MLRKSVRLLLVISLVLNTLWSSDTVKADSTINGTINVDLANDRGTFVRMEQYGNFTGRSSDQNGEIREEDLKFMQYNGLNTKMMRMWVNLQNDFIYYDTNGDETTTGSQVVRAEIDPVTSTIRHFNEMSPFVEEFLICIQHPKMGSGSVWDATGLKKRYGAAITALVKKYPQSKFFEVVNEPDLSSGSFYSSPEDYYNLYYKPHYEGIKIANDNLLLTGTPNELKLGGPVTAMFRPSDYYNYIQDFIQFYASDTAPNKRLDFIAYHEYGGSYKGDPAFFGTEQDLIRGWLRDNSLNQNMPIFISETGMFAGSQTSNLDFSSDLFVVAAGVAAMNYHYIYNGVGKSPQMYPFMWVPRHTKNDNWRKNMLVSHQLNNSSGAILSKFTPFGNMFKMLAMLRDNRVGTSVIPTRSGSAGNGESLGLYAFGTKDDKSVGVMMWNYQYDNRSSLDAPFDSGNVTYNVTANINRLDAIPAFTGKDVLVKLYSIDSFNSSYAHNGGNKITGAITEAADGAITIDKNLINLDGANLVPYQEYTTTPVNNTITVNYTFDRNKFRFVELIPVPRQISSQGQVTNLIASDVQDGSGDIISSGKTYFQSVNEYSSTINPVNAFDGNQTTEWKGKGVATGQYVGVNLGYEADLSRVEIDWYHANGDRSYQYLIEGKTGENAEYQVMVDKSGNTIKAPTVDMLSGKARYVRVKVLGSNKGASFDARICEIRVYGKSSAHSWQKNAVVEELTGEGWSVTSNTGNSDVNKLFDGNMATRWGASNGKFPYRVTLDLTRSHVLSDIEVNWYEGETGINQRIYRYTIEGSNDGTDYTMVYDGSRNVNFARTRDPLDTTARYIRINILGVSDGGYSSIKEIRLNGFKPVLSVYRPEFSRSGSRMHKLDEQAVSAVTRIENNGSGIVKVSLIAAFYDANGKLLNTAITNKTLLSSEEALLEVQMSSIPGNASYIKAFLWKDMGSLIPLTNQAETIYK